MLVSGLFLTLGLEDGHVPTFWLQNLYSFCIRNRKYEFGYMLHASVYIPISRPQAIHSTRLGRGSIHASMNYPNLV